MLSPINQNKNYCLQATVLCWVYETWELWSKIGLEYSNPQIVCKIQTIQRFSISKTMTKSKSIVFLRISQLYVLSTTNTFPFDMYSHTYDSLCFRKKHPHNVHIYTNCIFSEDVIVRPTKIMNNLFKDYKILTFKVLFPSRINRIFLIFLWRILD